MPLIIFGSSTEGTRILSDMVVRAGCMLGSPGFSKGGRGGTGTPPCHSARVMPGGWIKDSQSQS
jgi:hypothetical protein